MTSAVGSPLITCPIYQRSPSSKNLNLIIAKYHADTAALRRQMIEYGILERDGESVYWVVRDIVN
jgi:hypothetical protein